MIILQKGKSLELKKKDSASSYKDICVGVTWGKISKKGFFGGMKQVAVDLDLSLGFYDASNNLVDQVWYGKLKSRDKSTTHTGDDLAGGKDEDSDNETVIIDLSKVAMNTNKIAIVLNSFSRDDFSTIPYARMRLYEGRPNHPTNVITKYDVANDPKFAGSTSMIMGFIIRDGSSWSIKAIGEATTDRNLKKTLESVKRFL